MHTRLAGRRVAVLVETLYEDLELWYPVLRLREEGAEVLLAGPQQERYAGKHGLPAEADAAVGTLDAGDFDAVVVPGGYAPDHLRRHDDVISFVQAIHDRGGIVAAICHAPWVLVSARLLDGRRITCFESIRDDVENAGARYEDAEVVRDRNLVTSRKPSDLGAFCRTLIAALEERPFRDGKGERPHEHEARP